MFFRTAFAIVLGSSPVFAQDAVGTYIAVPNTNGVWIVDTTTGSAKFCFPRSNSNQSGGYEVICTNTAE